MFILVLLIYLYHCAEKNGCPLLTVECLETSDRRMHFDFNLQEGAL